MGFQGGFQEKIALHVPAEQEQSRRRGGHHGLPIELLANHRPQVDELSCDNLRLKKMRINQNAITSRYIQQILSQLKTLIQQASQHASNIY